MYYLLFKSLKKLIFQCGFVSIAIGVLCFILTKMLSGDAAYRIAAARYGYDLVDTAAAQAVRAELGLDQAIWLQLLRWLGDVLRFDLGKSMVSGSPVIEEVSELIAMTFQLSLTAWLLAIVVGVVLGWVAATGNKLTKAVINFYSTVIRSSPSFLIGLVLIIIFAIQLKWLPVAGHGEINNVILPALTLALFLSASIAQVVQSKLEQVLQSDSYEFTLIKGVPVYAALYRHALPATALPTIAYAGVQFILLMEGVVVVETLFAWPGIGHALVHAVVARDVPMIQGTAIITTILFISFSTLIDFLVKLADPRQRVR